MSDGKARQNFKDRTGQRYGRLVALERAPSQGGIVWLCRCDCGQTIKVRSGNIGRNHTESCGCLQRDRAANHCANNYKRHGHARQDKLTPTYRTWVGMRNRCRNPNNSDYNRYGGAGVKVCKRWDRFENFLADMGERPWHTSIDRINPFGNYELSNCRWASPKTQRNNQRKHYAKARN